jgi:hypothetical protein
VTPQQWKERAAALQVDAAMFRTFAAEAGHNADTPTLPDLDRDYARVLAARYREMADTATYYAEKAWTASRTAA